MAVPSFFTRVASALRARLAAGSVLAPTFKSVGGSGAALATAAAADQLAVAHVLAPAPTDGAASAKLLLFPMGQIATRDGRQFRLDDLAHAQAVIAASVAAAGNAEIACDYDHQMVFAVTKDVGGQAPASGWIKPSSLTADAKGIWGEVEWTAAAAAKLAEREYRYTSPTFTHDKAGRVKAIRFLSLVNNPAIDELPAVASTQEQPVDLSKIAAALGLAATATVEDIVAAIAKLTIPAASMATAATALGLAADATAEQIATAAAAAATPDPAKFVPVAAVKAVTDELAVLRGERHDRIIATASATGKLPPAMQAWAKDYLAKDEAGFNTWLAAQPVVVAPGATAADPLATAASQHGLTVDELAVAKALGVTPENFKAAKG